MKRYESPDCSRRSSKQVDDLRRHRDVERGDRLVADDEARPRSERTRDGDALALAARELRREPRRDRCRQSHVGEQCADARRAALCPARASAPEAARRPGRPRASADSARTADPGRRPAARGAGGGARVPRARASPCRRTRIRPASGSSRRATMRPAVVLPLPDSPTRPSVCPASIRKSTPRRAGNDPRSLPKTPRRIAKRFSRPSAERSASFTASPRRAGRAS